MNSRQNDNFRRSIKDKIQFSIEVAIFFATFVYAFNRSIGTEDAKASKVLLGWGAGVAFGILNYLLIDSVGDGCSWLKWINWSVIASIAVFALPIILLIDVSHAPISGLWYWPFMISMWASSGMPLLTLLLISINLGITVANKK